MAETNTIVEAPRPRQEILGTGQQLQYEDLELSIYTIPGEIDPSAPESDQPPLSVAVSDAEVYTRFMRGGVDAMADGEILVFTELAEDMSLYEVYSIIRRGDRFGMMIEAIPKQEVPTEAAASLQVALALESDEVRDFVNFMSTNGVPGEEMQLASQRQDGFGRAVRRLGFSKTGRWQPTPVTVRDNAAQLRRERTEAPRIRLFEQHKISSQNYVGAWRRREFPASKLLSYSFHDFTEEHYAGLLPYGDDGMEFGGLYADAVSQQKTIHARHSVKKENPAPNEPRFHKVDTLRTGSKKFDHAALTLDGLSSDLHDLSGNLDGDPEAELELGDLDRIEEMARVVMATQRPKFEAYLKKMGSEALIDDTFDAEVFCRDLLKGAQKRWRIGPHKPVPPKGVGMLALAA